MRGNLLSEDDQRSRPLPSPSPVYSTRKWTGVEPPCERNVNSVALLPGESLRSKVPPFLRSLPPLRREHASRIRRKREGWRFKVGIVEARRLFRTPQLETASLPFSLSTPGR